MVVLSGRIQWMLVMVLMLSTGFSGCFDEGRDGTDGKGWSLFSRGQEKDDEVVPAHQYERYWLQDPKDCEGCIPLVTPKETPVAKTPPPQPKVQIPFPHGGDLVVFDGRTEGFVRHQVPPIPTDEEGDYTGLLRVLAGDGENARFLFGLRNSFWTHTGHRIVADEVTWNVSLDSRIVTNGSALGYVHLPGHLHSESRTARFQLEPRLESLFWLGSHVWGRELAKGDSFTVHLEVPGTDGGHLRFAYEVLRVTPSDGRLARTHGVAAWPPGAALRVEVTDMSGMQGAWDMTFTADSPYPAQMYTRTSPHHGLHQGHVPRMPANQHLDLQERGDEPLPWSGTLLRPAAPAPPSDGGFVLGERQASVALDALPLYPLRDALADLTFHEPGYADYVAAHPARVLYAATYHSRLLTEQVLLHDWVVSFTDRDGGVAAWSVSRLSVAGVLAPAAHAHERVAAERSPVVDRLADATPSVRLASGSAGLERFAALGIQAADRMEYRLASEGEDGIGGTLAAYRDLVHAVSRPDEASPAPLGYFLQDLATRTLTESAVFMRHY